MQILHRTMCIHSFNYENLILNYQIQINVFNGLLRSKRRSLSLLFFANLVIIYFHNFGFFQPLFSLQVNFFKVQKNSIKMANEFYTVVNNNVIRNIFSNRNYNLHIFLVYYSKNLYKLCSA